MIRLQIRPCHKKNTRFLHDPDPTKMSGSGSETVPKYSIHVFTHKNRLSRRPLVYICKPFFYYKNIIFKEAVPIKVYAEQNISGTVTPIHRGAYFLDLLIRI